MYRYLRHDLFFYLLILVVLTGAPGRADAIWCLPLDGQAHLESLLDSHCGTEHHPVAPEPSVAASFTAADSCCGPCIDHATGGELLQIQQRLLQIPVPPLALLPTPPLLSSPRVQDPHRSLTGRQNFRPPPTLLALRTTVLRC